MSERNFLKMKKEGVGLSKAAKNILTQATWFNLENYDAIKKLALKGNHRRELHKTLKAEIDRIKSIKLSVDNINELSENELMKGSPQLEQFREATKNNLATLFSQPTPQVIYPTIEVTATPDFNLKIFGTAILSPSENLIIKVNGATYSITPDTNNNWAMETKSKKPIDGKLGKFINKTPYKVTATITSKSINFNKPVIAPTRNQLKNFIDDALENYEGLIDTINPTLFEVLAEKNKNKFITPPKSCLIFSLDARDDEIESVFTKWLNSARVKYNTPEPKTKRGSRVKKIDRAIDSLIEWKVIPYWHLKIWADLEDVYISDDVMAKIIFNGGAKQKKFKDGERDITGKEVWREVKMYADDIFNDYFYNLLNSDIDSTFIYTHIATENNPVIPSKGFKPLTKNDIKLGMLDWFQLDLHKMPDPPPIYLLQDRIARCLGLRYLLNTLNNILEAKKNNDLNDELGFINDSEALDFTINTIKKEFYTVLAIPKTHTTPPPRNLTYPVLDEPSYRALHELLNNQIFNTDPRVFLLISLNAKNSEILAELKNRIKNKRNDLAAPDPLPTERTDITINKISRYRIIPYVFLKSWAELEGWKIDSNLMYKILFPDKPKTDEAGEKYIDDHAEKYSKRLLLRAFNKAIIEKEATY